MCQPVPESPKKRKYDTRNNCPCNSHPLLRSFPFPLVRSGELAMPPRDASLLGCGALKVGETEPIFGLPGIEEGKVGDVGGCPASVDASFSRNSTHRREKDLTKNMSEKVTDGTNSYRLTSVSSVLSSSGLLPGPPQNPLLPGF